LSVAFKLWMPELPFIDRVGVVFLLCAGIAIAWSLARPKAQPGFVEPSRVEFGTSTAFNLSTLAVTLILVFFYTVWW